MVTTIQLILRKLELIKITCQASELPIGKKLKCTSYLQIQNQNQQANPSQINRSNLPAEFYSMHMQLNKRNEKMQ